MVIYTVQRGDTLAEIAQQHGQSLGKLKQYNGNIQNIDPRQLKIGTKLEVGDTYIAAKGDTLTKIAREHDLSLWELYEWNSTLDPEKKGHDLKAGQVLALDSDKSEAEPKAEPKTEPKVEPKAEPKVEPKAEPKAEPKVETAFEVPSYLKGEKEKVQLFDPDKTIAAIEKISSSLAKTLRSGNGVSILWDPEEKNSAYGLTEEEAKGLLNTFHPLFDKTKKGEIYIESENLERLKAKELEYHNQTTTNPEYVVENEKTNYYLDKDKTLEEIGKISPKMVDLIKNAEATNPFEMTRLGSLRTGVFDSATGLDLEKAKELSEKFPMIFERKGSVLCFRESNAEQLVKSDKLFFDTVYWSNPRWHHEIGEIPTTEALPEEPSPEGRRGGEASRNTNFFSASGSRESSSVSPSDYIFELVDAMYDTETKDLLDANRRAADVVRKANGQHAQKNSTIGNTWKKDEPDIPRVALLLYDPREDYLASTTAVLEKAIKDNYGENVTVIKKPVTNKDEFSTAFEDLGKSCQGKEVMICCQFHGAGSSKTDGEMGIGRGNETITEQELKAAVESLQGELSTDIIINSCMGGRFKDLSGLIPEKNSSSASV